MSKQDLPAKAGASEGPAEPTEAAEATEAAQAADSVEPTERTEAVAPTEAAEVTEPAEAGAGTGPAELKEAKEVAGPAEAAEVTEPAGIGAGTGPAELKEAKEVAGPAEAAEVTEPAEAGAGTGPAEPRPAEEPPAEAGEDAAAAADPGEAPARKKTRRRGRRVLLTVLAVLLLAVIGAGALVYERQASYDRNVDRIPGVMPTNTDRPKPSAAGSENWLLVGFDDGAVEVGQGADISKVRGHRSDTLILLHLPADRENAYIVSIPRDSWVEVPGRGHQKINAAFSFGGPALLIRTVEKLTGIRVDHYGAVDFGGFQAMTDALGGVDVTIAKTVYDPANNVTWRAGRQHLNGERALLFVRQRQNLPNGDFDRIKRQQAFLRALAKKASDGGTISNPIKLNRFLRAFTKSISVDDSMSSGDLRSLALGLRGLRPQDVQFLTVPNKGPAMRGVQSVVLLDEVRARELYTAVRGDEMAGYVRRNGGTNSVGTVS
ncbi:LytR family transcriptional regulator [Actinomadura craniellae]|uniref:LytR family transcriptional regulator n=1 Tax=Actinomadura craniellae TaxID=2231787 RepID=A0A365H8F6_9ACTN|nr:LCP family protein [Actinomadura craniellae]RAY15319.1 LytR family transcriptional regulator [Actinomadura craniellae]